MLLPDVLRRAALTAAHARRLRLAAALLRRHAGVMRYHPVTGQRPDPSPELVGAIDDLARVLGEVQRDAPARAEEETWAASRGDAAAREIRGGHESIEQGARVTAAAIEVLRGVLGGGENASLDAPYGHGAPKRHHPGALCTIVAERAENLAQALESVAIVKANLQA